MRHSTRVLGFALCVGAAAIPGVARSEGEFQMTCKGCLAEAGGSRDRIVGSSLWVWLKANAENVAPNQAGSLIAIAPSLRTSAANACKAEVAGPLLVPTLGVTLTPAIEAALRDPKIR
jgi:hypothetical protein